MNNEHKFDEVIVIEHEEQEADLQPPKRYSVVLLNDDFTPMDWVINVLVKYFTKIMDDAVRIMLHIHEKGEGVAVSNLSLDLAETKALMIISLSQAQGYPLQAVVRQEE